MPKYTILGAGLAGISASYHLGHDRCQIFEKNAYLGGHIHSWESNGFTWDEGPHVSFTKSEYVRNLFEQNVEGELLEYPVETSNYFEGSWIPHPAQSNLWAVPQPLRDHCLDNMLKSRAAGNSPMGNYEEWLIEAFGEQFYQAFPAKYTRKYWTVDPKFLTTDWVGERVFYPDLETVKSGYQAKLEEQTHYIKKIRYPKKGGYFSFARKMYENANIHVKKSMKAIDFDSKQITFDDGSSQQYEKLISTIPLPVLLSRSNAPNSIKEAAERLSCSSVLIVNVIAGHPTVRKDNWIYVYDEDKYSTRVNCTELLSSNNGVQGQTGVQVEVYFSNYKKKALSDQVIGQKVAEELVEMGLINSKSEIQSVETRWVQWANVIFDHHRRECLDQIFSYLATKGLIREEDDLESMTNWDQKESPVMGDIFLAGRFAQWKYYWTDDCVLRTAKFI